MTIQNDIISFPEGTGSPNIVALANNTAIINQTADGNYGQLRTTLSGIALLADLRFYSLVSVNPETGPGPGVAVAPGEASWFVLQYMNNFKGFNEGTVCAPSWSDPLADVMAGLNEVR